jgi:hypothetical protein
MILHQSETSPSLAGHWYVSGIYGKAVAWTHTYGLIEWLDSSGKYHTGWAHSSSIKRVTPEEWKGSGGL